MCAYSRAPFRSHEPLCSCDNTLGLFLAKQYVPDLFADPEDIISAFEVENQGIEWKTASFCIAFLVGLTNDGQTEVLGICREDEREATLEVHLSSLCLSETYITL